MPRFASLGQYCCWVFLAPRHNAECGIESLQFGLDDGETARVTCRRNFASSLCEWELVRPQWDEYCGLRGGGGAAGVLLVSGYRPSQLGFQAKCETHLG